MRLTLMAFTLALSLVLGCIESNPQPSPGQDTGNGRWDPTKDDSSDSAKSPSAVDDDLIYASAVGADGETIIVGAAGAAMDASGGNAASGGDEAPAGEDSDGDFAVNDDGSFVVVVPVVVPPKISLVFKYSDSDDVTVEIVLPGGDADDDASPWMYSGEEEPSNGPPAEFDGFDNGAGAFYGILVSDIGDGTIEVVGSFLSVTPLAKVVLANLATGKTATVQATNTGEFVATLPGMAGDAISVFAVNPEEKEKATEAVVLTVE
jgi:hypothetical protein